MTNDLVFELDSTTSALRITLGDLLVFINWMQQADKALENGELLPETPEVESGKVLGWVTLMQKLDERMRQGCEKQLALEANLVVQEAQLRDLLSQLHGNLASLYENLGLEQKAQEVRRRAEAVQTC